MGPKQAVISGKISSFSAGEFALIRLISDEIALMASSISDVMSEDSQIFIGRRGAGLFFKAVFSAPKTIGEIRAVLPRSALLCVAFFKKSLLEFDFVFCGRVFMSVLILVCPLPLEIENK